MITNTRNADLPKRIGFFCGSSGSGKTHQIKRQLQQAGKERSILIWDPEEEYCGPNVRQCGTLAEFAGVLFEHRARCEPVVISFTGGVAREQFDAFCALCWSVRGTEFPTVVVVDELASVTTVSRAPGYWLILLNRGRKYDMWIFAGSQRPAEVDKTVLSQKNYLFVGYLETRADHQYLSSKLSLSREQLETLRPSPHFDHWIVESGKEPVFGTADGA